MKFILPLIVLFIAMSCNKKPNYEPAAHLDVKEKSRIHSLIVRSIGKMPEKANDSTKMEKQFDTYYQELASKHVLKKYFIAENGDHFFLEWRQAPSLHEKYVATGGKLRMDADGNLAVFEEIFRTWKMHPDTLSRRGSLLFDRMVNGQSLREFETAYSKGVEYIEFPDENVYYDKQARKWRSKQFESVESIVAGD